jgi:hemolysin activation/secretion protein
MNRRQILKSLAMATTAAVLLPQCIADPKKVSLALNNLDINGDEEELLANIADTLIPATDKPGAKAVGAHHFALVMVDDCTSKEDKDKYLKGMRAFDDYCTKINGTSFTDSNSEERLALLKEIEKQNESLPEEIKTFYSLTRRYIVRGYTTSEYYLTEVKPYQHIPGPVFQGCVPVAQTQNPV